MIDALKASAYPLNSVSTLAQTAAFRSKFTDYFLFLWQRSSLFNCVRNLSFNLDSAVAHCEHGDRVSPLTYELSSRQIADSVSDEPPILEPLAFAAYYCQA